MDSRPNHPEAGVIAPSRKRDPPAIRRDRWLRLFRGIGGQRLGTSSGRYNNLEELQPAIRVRLRKDQPASVRTHPEAIGGLRAVVTVDDPRGSPGSGDPIQRMDTG